MSPWANISKNLTASYSNMDYLLHDYFLSYLHKQMSKYTRRESPHIFFFLVLLLLLLLSLIIRNQYPIFHWTAAINPCKYKKRLLMGSLINQKYVDFLLVFYFLETPKKSSIVFSFQTDSWLNAINSLDKHKTYLSNKMERQVSHKYNV